MTLRAHRIPVLHVARPMQWVGTGDRFIRVEMKPTLAAGVFRPGIPGPGQSLKPAVRKSDEILLQRLDAKGVTDREARDFAVAPFGLDHETIAVAEKSSFGAMALHGDVAKIAEDGFRRRDSHSARMMRLSPSGGLRRMTSGACRGADVACRCRRCEHADRTWPERGGWGLSINPSADERPESSDHSAEDDPASPIAWSNLPQ